MNEANLLSQFPFLSDAIRKILSKNNFDGTSEYVFFILSIICIHTSLSYDHTEKPHAALLAEKKTR
jgi:hypothetical protein